MSQQGWGPPPGGEPNANPYAPPTNPYGPPTNPYGPPGGWDEQPNFTPEGNLAAGLAAGFLCGCIGLILVLIIAKGPATKKGAWIGFAIQAVLGVAMQLIQVSNH